MTRLLLVLAAALAVSGSADAISASPAPGPPPPPTAFFLRLQRLCGQSFAGRVVTNDPADAAFAGKPLVMTVAQCADEEIRIPFSVGEDRSRTWVITRTGLGLALKHDHRHADGTEDVLSQYGGETLSYTGGSARRQTFPADAFSKTLFLEKGNPASVDNVWAMEIRPGKLFAYELRRPGRFFRVEFDLTRPL